MIPEIKKADEIISEMNNLTYEKAEMLRTNLEKCTSSVTDISVQGSHRLHTREDALLLLAEMTSMLDDAKNKLYKIYKNIDDRDLRIYFDKVYFKLNNAQLQLKYNLTKSQINRIVKKVKENHNMRP